MKKEKLIRLFSACIFTLLILPGFSNPIDSRQSLILQQQINKYYDIASSGGWGKISLDKKYYIKGESGSAIKQVKLRMKATGEYEINDESTLFTEELVAAVKKARKQFGLPIIGTIDAALVKELNVPVEKRIAQLQSNVERFQKLNISSQGTHLVANIPEFKLHVYENGVEAFDMNIVVGKPSTKTVVFDGQLSNIVFSPYWNVPPNIVKQEIIPAAKRNKAYLKNNGYEVVGNEGGLPVIRQKPGGGNSLGKVKFVFPNSHNIYFHDTPAKSLFKMDKRAYSHGCVRLAEPAKLAAYLLRNDAVWTDSKIQASMDKGSEQWVKLGTSVPVSIVYFTAWVDDEGILNFREDIYGIDKAATDMKVAKM